MPHFFNALHRKLKWLQRRLKTKRKGSANWLKLQKKMARVHQRIADTRQDWHFNTTWQSLRQDQRLRGHLNG